MGVIYYVACRQCKVYRDIDKAWRLGNPLTTREDALEFVNTVKKDAYRAGLLATFIVGEHGGHDCFVCSDASEMLPKKYKKEDVNFW